MTAHSEAPRLLDQAADFVATSSYPANWPLKFNQSDVDTLVDRMQGLSNAELIALARAAELLSVAAEIAATQRVNKTVRDEIAELKGGTTRSFQARVTVARDGRLTAHSVMTVGQVDDSGNFTAVTSRAVPEKHSGGGATAPRRLGETLFDLGYRLTHDDWANSAGSEPGWIHYDVVPSARA